MIQSFLINYSKCRLSSGTASSSLPLCSKLPDSLLCWPNACGLSGHDLFDSAIPRWHHEVWWCSAMGREEKETSGSWGSLMLVLLPEDWFDRGLAAQICRITKFGSKSTFVSLPCWCNSRQKERSNSGQVYEKGRCPVLWFVGWDWPSKAAQGSHCVLEREMQREIITKYMG